MTLTARCLLVICLCPMSLSAAEYFGVVEPWQIIRVGSPVLGIVDELPVDRGDVIETGALLAKLNSDIEAVDLSLAQTRFELASNRYERQAHMQEKALASDEEVEKARIELALARLELQRITLFFNQKRILSPISGIVTERLVRSGEYVYEQVPVVEVAQMNPLSVELLVPFTEYGKIKVGMTSEVTLEDPIGGQYLAEVDVVDRVMDAASSTFGVRLRLANPDASIPSGVKCTVKFLSDSQISDIQIGQ